MQSAYVCVLCTGGGFSYAPRGVERWECVQWVAEDPEVPEGSQVSFDGGWSKAFGTKKATKSVTFSWEMGKQEREKAAAKDWWCFQPAA